MQARTGFLASRVQITGVPIKVVSERLGHSTIAMTMDVYAHVLPAQDRDASAAIRRALQGQGGGRGPTSHP